MITSYSFDKEVYVDNLKISNYDYYKEVYVISKDSTLLTKRYMLII